MVWDVSLEVLPRCQKLLMASGFLATDATSAMTGAILTACLMAAEQGETRATKREVRGEEEEKKRMERDWEREARNRREGKGGREGFVGLFEGRRRRRVKGSSQMPCQGRGEVEVRQGKKKKEGCESEVKECGGWIRPQVGSRAG